MANMFRLAARTQRAIRNGKLTTIFGGIFFGAMAVGAAFGIEKAQQIDRRFSGLGMPLMCETIKSDKMANVEKSLRKMTKLIFNVNDNLVGDTKNSGYGKVTQIDVKRCTMIEQVLQDISKSSDLMVNVFDGKDELGCFSAITVTVNTATGNDTGQERKMLRWEFVSRN